jgi:peptidoglycan hydrolase-like protein with peptidoglycan-binding domain/TPR repeat protein
MSRSYRAWRENCVPPGTASGVGEQSCLAPRVRLGHQLRLGAISSIKCPLQSLFVALVIAATVLAGSASGAQAKPRTTDTQQPSAQPSSAGAVTLALGSGFSSRTGATHVRVLQRSLATAGFSPGPIDGLYGPLTQAAVEGFQASRRLQVDGIAGPITLRSLHSSADALYPGAGYIGSDSVRVRTMQRRLARAGFSPGPIDGRYGPLTTHAVARFQAAHGLRANGIADPRTLAKLAPPAHHVTRPAGSGSSHRRAHRPSPTPPTRPQPAPAPEKSAPAVHPASSPPLGVIVALIALAVALTLATTLLIHRRRHQPPTTVGAMSDGASRNGHAEATTADVTPTPTPTPTPTTTSTPDQTTSTPDQTTSTPDQTTSTPDQTTMSPTISTPSPEEQHASGDSAFDYALMLEKHGDEQGAIAAYQRADRLGHGAAATNLGVLLEQHGEPAAAQAAYRRASERGDGDGAFNLALLLGERGDQEGAIAAYERADELGHAAATTNLGMLLEQQGDPAAAETAYRRAEQRGDSNGAFNLALLLGDHGDHAGAIAAYERADRLGHAIAATNLGVLLEQQGDLEAAQAAYRRAEQRGDAHGAFNLGVLLEERGDHVAALEAYQRAERLGHPEIAEMARAAEVQLSKHERSTRTGGGQHDR